MTNIYKKRLMSATALSALALGVLAFNPEVTQAKEGTVDRIQGNNRYETATLISNQTFESSDTVIIANAMAFADALSGVPLAYEKEAPILLAHGTKLKTSTITEIKRLGAKEAIILGGDAAISPSIENELKALGLSVQRLSGDNRYETSAIIADELAKTAPSDKAVVVDGMEFADAMSIAPFAAQTGMPIYLTKTNSLSNAEELKDYSETYIVGGENAVSKLVEEALNSVTRLAGMDRYETNREVIDHFGVVADELYVSTGLNFADALTGSVLAARNNSAVALVKGDVHSKLLDHFEDDPFNAFTILGGEAAVSNKVQNTLTTYIASKTEVAEEVKQENFEDFVVKEVEEDTLPTGEINIIQEGKDGYDEVTYEVTFVNGAETARTEVKRLTLGPIEEIKEIGTQVTEVIEEVEIENKIEYSTVTKENSNLPEGEDRVLQEGKDGYDEVIYSVTLVNGAETTRTEEKRITLEPIEEIKEIGTQVTEVIEEVINENEIDFKTTNQENDQLPEGDTRIIQEGVVGYEKVTYAVTYVNGIKISRSENSRKTINPVKEIIEVGTKQEVAGISISTPVVELIVGESELIIAEIIPSNATINNVNWSSSNQNVATIDNDGNLKALAVGTTIISGETVDGGYIDSFELEVKPVKMDILTITTNELELLEMEKMVIETVISPSNTTNKNLIWTSGDDDIATVDSEGLVLAIKAGVVDITVTNEDKSVTDTVSLEVLKPTIINNKDLNFTITQFDEFNLPEQIVVELSNGFEKEVDVNWNETAVDTSNIGEFIYDGVVDYYAYNVELELTINEFIPDVYTNAYSSVTINGLSKSLSIQLYNYEYKPLEINKIEIYERGRLYKTYSASQLISSGINTTVKAREQWGMSISSKIGIWVDNSYVKYYVEINGNEYIFTESL